MSYRQAEVSWGDGRSCCSCRGRQRRMAPSTSAKAYQPPRTGSVPNGVIVYMAAVTNLISASSSTSFDSYSRFVVGNATLCFKCPKRNHAPM
jgi:hypothetical protein